MESGFARQYRSIVAPEISLDPAGMDGGNKDAGAFMLEPDCESPGVHVQGGF